MRTSCPSRRRISLAVSLATATGYHPDAAIAGAPGSRFGFPRAARLPDTICPPGAASVVLSGVQPPPLAAPRMERTLLHRRDGSVHRDAGRLRKKTAAPSRALDGRIPVLHLRPQQRWQVSLSRRNSRL